MRRRDFIAGLGSAAICSGAALAQQPVTTIGFLTLDPGPRVQNIAAFVKGLSEMGYDEGRNLAIEFRWAHNDFNLLPEMAADLVRRQVAVIVGDGTAAPLATKALDQHNPNCFQRRWGPRPIRPRFEFQSAGRQRDRRVRDGRGAWDEKVRALA